MKVSVYLRWMLRESRGARGRMVYFAACLAIGVAAVVGAAALSEASDFGVFEIDDAGDLVSFQEKPKNPKPIPGRPDEALVSMGNYFFRYSALQEVLAADIQDSSSSHDFGKDIIPKMLKGGYKVAIYDFSKNRIPGESDEIPPYWRDVGNLDSYFDANMDLRAAVPPLNLYNFRSSCCSWERRWCSPCGTTGSTTSRTSLYLSLVWMRASLL